MPQETWKVINNVYEKILYSAPEDRGKLVYRAGEEVTLVESNVVHVKFTNESGLDYKIPLQLRDLYFQRS